MQAWLNITMAKPGLIHTLKTSLKPILLYGSVLKHDSPGNDWAEMTSQMCSYSLLNSPRLKNRHKCVAPIL